MDSRTFEALEVGPMLDLLARHVQTPLGRGRVAGLQPLADRERILHEQDLTTEAAEYLGSGAGFGLGGIEDPGPALAQLHVEATALDPFQILLLERLIAVGLDLRGVFRDAETRALYPSLACLADQIPDLGRLLSAIRGKVLPGGELDDNASPELRAIRREMQDARARIHRHLESILRSESRAVQEEIVTFRNGRFVIPIRTDSRGLVPGVVHGLSGSGQTTFVEPLSVIDQNNELVRLREQEEEEIARILLAISDALRESLPAITTATYALAEFDFAQAKGRLSLEFKCCRPAMSPDRRLLLSDARHALLEHMLRASGGAAVPISLELDGGHQVLVISGPNAGGKTVVLKTVGLAALMAQMGLHVPAREAVLPVYSRVFADIGDQQSISANLSTFTAHMRNVSEMAREVAPEALLLIDEVGTGTDPDEGSALAVAIVDHFRRTGATTIVTTHYNGLKMWASQAQGVRNASVEFDEETLRPTYRLLLNVAGASAGLEIARRMDIPEGILGAARALMGRDQLQAAEYLKQLKSAADEQQALIEALESERRAMAEKYASLEAEHAGRESARRLQFEAALLRALQDFRLESERILGGLKERSTAERLKRTADAGAAELKRAADRIRREAETQEVLSPGLESAAKASVPATPQAEDAPIRAGDRVQIVSLGREGTVESAHGDAFTVTVGSLRYRASRKDLLRIGPAESSLRVQVSAAGMDVDSVVPDEINLIGTTADEARDRVDKFLDGAFLAGLESVRIIHGHGKGILRRAIADLLTGHPQVGRFALAPPEMGGGGVTIVELKK